MDTFYVVTYFLLWVVTFIIYWRRKRNLDAGWVIILSFLINAGLAILLYLTPTEYYEFEPLRFFPFVYLFFMLLIAVSPVLRFDSQQITKIEPPNIKLINLVAWFFIGTMVCNLPEIVSSIMQGGVLNLFSNADAGWEMYANSAALSADAGKRLSNFFAICSNALFDVCILLLFYYLTLPTKNKVLLVCLALAIGLCVIIPIFRGQRGMVVMGILTIVMTYFLLRAYMSKKVKKWVDLCGLTLCCIAVLPLVAITISRFDERGSMDSVVYYAGQAPLNFNNYGLDAGGIRNGDRTFNLVKRLVDSSTPSNYVERREKYYYLKMDDNIFYTFVGDFTLDFGPYIAPLIFLLFTGLVLRLTKPEKDKIAFHQLLLIYLVACICMQGSFYLFAYADTAGLKIVVLLIFYFVLKYMSNKNTKESVSICQD